MNNADRILTGNALRDWDPADTKRLYWAGACHALITGTDMPGCKTRIADNYARKAGLL